MDWSYHRIASTHQHPVSMGTNQSMSQDTHGAGGGTALRNASKGVRNHVEGGYTLVVRVIVWIQPVAGVVPRALLVVGEDSVRFADLLEAELA